MTKPENNEITINPTALGKTIGMWIGVIFPLWGVIAYGFAYEKDIMKKSEYDMSVYVKKSEDSFDNLEARIERTRILIAVYSRNPETLTEKEKNEYEAAKARLISLTEQRDRIMGVP